MSKKIIRMEKKNSRQCMRYTEWLDVPPDWIIYNSEVPILKYKIKLYHYIILICLCVI